MEPSKRSKKSFWSSALFQLIVMLVSMMVGNLIGRWMATWH